MGNTAYCRFRNTSKALEECLKTLEECETEISSQEEREACIEMFDRLVSFLDENGLVSADSNDNFWLNKETLEQMMGTDEEDE